MQIFKLLVAIMIAFLFGKLISKLKLPSIAFVGAKVTKSPDTVKNIM